MTKTILVVEAEHDVRVEIRRILEDAGYFVVSSTSGDETLSLLPRMSLPFAILLSGSALTCEAEIFIKALRASPGWAGIPLIHLKDPAEASPSGMCGRVLKPEISRTLLGEIARALGPQEDYDKKRNQGK
jgi:CheY-like chemotaxis protein